MDSDLVDDSASNVFSQPLRPRFSRVKTGCLTCRRRKKKCDEERPRCKGCSRNKLTCSWPEFGPEEDASRARKGQPGHHHGSPSGSVNSEDSIETITAAPKFNFNESSQLPRDNTVRWSPTLQSFTAPDRAATLTTKSLTLLQHYITNTSGLMVSTNLKQNPFLTEILPLAYVDDLLMHGLLAISGAHLFYENQTDTDAQTAVLTHYSSMVRGVRLAFQDVSPDEAKTLRTLLALVLLSYFEAMSGNLTGAIFPHLRASRQIIMKLLSQQNQTRPRDKNNMLGFALEAYSYLVLINSITPYGILEARTVPIDSYVTSLDSLRQYSTFGTILSGGHGLLEIVPHISALFAKRLAEEQLGAPSQECCTEYLILRSRIERWQSDELEDTAAILASEAFRHGLHVYLEGSMAGSRVSPEAMSKLEPHVQAFEPLFRQLDDYPVQNIMLWPAMIVHSCLVDQGEQQAAMNHLLSTKYQFQMCKSAMDLLQLLWEEPDPRAFGPYGLTFVMNKHNISVCIA